MKKLLDVSQYLINAYGDAVEEPVIQNQKVKLTDGSWKPIGKMKPDDDVEVEPVKLGKIIIGALDGTKEGLDAKEKVERFMLSCRVAQAMKDDMPLEISREDEKRIDEAAELLASGMAVARVKDALSLAKVPEKA